jgi:hypothetical protein
VANGPRAISSLLIDLSNFCPNSISELSCCRMFTLQHLTKYLLVTISINRNVYTK